MVEFELGGFEYRAEKLTVPQQAKIAKRIVPLLPPLVPLFQQIAKTGVGDFSGFGNLLQPLADSITKLPDESLDYVIDTCLSVVRRKHDGNWIPVWNAAAHRAMLEDLNDLSAVIPLVVRVIKDSLSPFLAALPTNPSEATAP